MKAQSLVTALAVSLVAALADPSARYYSLKVYLCFLIVYLQALLDLAGVPELAGGGMSWAVNERQAEALVRAHEAVMRVSLD